MKRFCEYLNEKCLDDGRSIRKIALSAKISHPYLLDLIKGRRNPPDISTQIDIANALELENSDRKILFDLAASERKEVPADIYSFLLNDVDAREKIRGEING